jgi:hypothetical protein
VKKTVGVLVMFGSWFIALAAVVTLVYWEFTGGADGRAVRYGDIVSAQANARKFESLMAVAHHEWYVVTLLVGAALAFSSLAYLMYVKFVEEPYGQEAVVLGAASTAARGSGGLN